MQAFVFVAMVSRHGLFLMLRCRGVCCRGILLFNLAWHVFVVATASFMVCFSAASWCGSFGCCSIATWFVLPRHRGMVCYLLPQSHGMVCFCCHGMFFFTFFCAAESRLGLCCVAATFVFLVAACFFVMAALRCCSVFFAVLCYGIAIFLLWCCLLFLMLQHCHVAALAFVVSVVLVLSQLLKVFCRHFFDNSCCSYCHCRNNNNLFRCNKS